MQMESQAGLDLGYDPDSPEAPRLLERTVLGLAPDDSW